MINHNRTNLYFCTFLHFLKTISVDIMSTEVSFEDEATVKAAFADVRNDAVDITYAICEHVDGRPDRLRLLCTGTDTSELGSKMDSADPLYILARYDTQFDLSVTTKFVYIMW